MTLKSCRVLLPMVALVFFTSDPLLSQERDLRDHPRKRKTQNIENLKKRIKKEITQGLLSGKSPEEIHPQLTRLVERFFDKKRLLTERRFPNNPQKLSQELRKLNRQILNLKRYLKKTIEEEGASHRSNQQDKRIVEREVEFGFQSALKKYKTKQRETRFEKISKKMKKRLRAAGLSEKEIRKKISQRKDTIQALKKKRLGQENKNRKLINDHFRRGQSSEEIRKKLMSDEKQNRIDKPNPEKRQEKLKNKGYSREEIEAILNYLAD